MLTDYRVTFDEWYRAIGHKASIDTLEEAFDASSVPNKGANPAEVFIGRLQPVHQGHVNIIKKMKNPIVVLVKGKQSSKDTDRNPLSASEQTRMLKKVFPNVRVVVAKTGYLPEIFAQLRETNGIEIKKVFAGADRLSGYERQITSINKNLDKTNSFDVEFVETERFTSATKVREAIRSDDYETFKLLMPKELYDEYDNLRKLIK